MIEAPHFCVLTRESIETVVFWSCHFHTSVCQITLLRLQAKLVSLLAQHYVVFLKKAGVL